MVLILPRRKFLIGLASVLAAPAIIKYDNLMPVKGFLIESDLERLWREIRAEGHFRSDVELISSSNTLRISGVRDISYAPLPT